MTAALVLVVAASVSLEKVELDSGAEDVLSPIVEAEVDTVAVSPLDSVEEANRVLLEVSTMLVSVALALMLLDETAELPDTPKDGVLLEDTIELLDEAPLDEAIGLLDEVTSDVMLVLA